MATVVTGGAAHAQQIEQKVSGPQARYWVAAETSSGFGGMGAMGGMGGMGAPGGAGAAGQRPGAGGMSGMMASLMGGGGPSKSLRLDLGSTRGNPQAQGLHNVPDVLGMGPNLPLLGPAPPEPGRPAPPREEERDIPEYKQPEGNARMLFFWGCGDNVGPGQPLILDMREIASGRLPTNLRSVAVRDPARGPTQGRDAGYADWPNRQDAKAVPSAASLVGQHVVSSNIANDIRFNVPAANDYLGALELQASEAGPKGSLLKWTKVERALGYFATAMGSKQTAPKEADIVMWNSSAQRLMGGQELMGFLAPAEVRRLIGEQVVMNADTTECNIPKQVVDAAGGRLFLNSLNAFGPEFNHIHPPRPEDPRVEWKQEYSVKIRTRSSTSTLAGMPSMRDMRRPPQETAQTPTPASTQAASPATTAASQPSKNPLDAVKGEVGNVLKGLFGR